MTNALRALACALVVAVPAVAAAQTPGLALRQSIGAYLDGRLPASGNGAIPATLSATGVFSNLSGLTPHAGLVPYGVNAASWSDGAAKQRWIAVPYSAGSGTSPTVGFAPTGEWAFPAGTVFVKHFDLVTNEQTGAARRLETRILVRDGAGGVYGRTYRWRADGSDADRVDAAANETLTITQADGTTRTQVYSYPSPSQCLSCHGSAANRILGVKTRQQNGDFTYAATGRTDNQLRTWNALGMFDQNVPDAAIATFAKLANLADTSATLEHRVRSYLDTNCASCHRPGGSGPKYDARFDTPILSQNLAGDAIDNPGAALWRHDLGASSRVLERARRPMGQSPMPPIGRNVVDQTAIEVLSAWITHAFDVASASSRGTHQVRVAFNAPLDAASATATGNYALDSGATVTAAALEADGRTVTLSTSALTPGATYKLVVNRVREAAAPGNTVWPNSRASFTAAAPGPFVRNDADGSGTSDIFWRDADGQVALWLMNGTTVSGGALLLGPSTGWGAEKIGDFNGDGRADVLWKHANGAWALWLLDGATVIGSASLVGPGSPWNVTHVADFDGNGTSDLLWKHSDGSVAMWLMAGTSPASSSIVFGATTVWSVTHTADLDGDGRADLVWRHADGRVAGWLMNGLAATSVDDLFGPGTTWRVAETGDFNGDAKHDLLFRDAGGQLSMFLMDGLAVASSGIVYAGGAFALTHVADFDGDARFDLLFKDAGGQVSMWLMDGLSVAASGVIFGGGGWVVTHTGFYDAGIRADLLWRDANGQVAIWTMDGLTVTGGAVIFGGGGGWVTN